MRNNYVRSEVRKVIDLFKIYRSSGMGSVTVEQIIVDTGMNDGQVKNALDELGYEIEPSFGPTTRGVVVIGSVGTDKYKMEEG
jgi:hypothetical protein